MTTTMAQEHAINKSVYFPTHNLPKATPSDLLLVIGSNREILIPNNNAISGSFFPLAPISNWLYLTFEEYECIPVGCWLGSNVYGILLDAEQAAKLIESGALRIDVREYYRVGGSLPFELYSRLLHSTSWNNESRYCPRCGKPIRWKSDEFAKNCGTCGFDIYPRINPAVIMAVLDGDSILLAKNAVVTFPFWSILAGYVEVGESLEQTVAREVYEEAGLLVDNICYVGSQPWAFSQSLMVGYTCTLAEGQTQSDLRIDEKELSVAQWFKLSDLPETPPPPSMASIIIEHIKKAAR